jgi:spore coat protein U-like protein
VNITVQSACQVSATHATFRTYTAAVANATSSVSVTCTNPTPYNVSFIAGSAISTNIPTFKSIGAGPALPSLALQTGLQKIFNLKPTLNGNTAARTLTLQAANRSYAIDAASTYPGVVIVVVSY